MAKGTVAKETIEKIIIEALGDKYQGIQDKKIYCRADDGGEMVQVAISMTCPKTPIDFGAFADGEPAAGGAAPATPKSTELSLEDKVKIEELMNSLGLAAAGA